MATIDPSQTLNVLCTQFSQELDNLPAQARRVEGLEDAAMMVEAFTGKRPTPHRDLTQIVTNLMTLLQEHEEQLQFQKDSVPSVSGQINALITKLQTAHKSLGNMRIGISSLITDTAKDLKQRLASIRAELDKIPNARMPSAIPANVAVIGATAPAAPATPVVTATPVVPAVPATAPAAPATAPATPVVTPAARVAPAVTAATAVTFAVPPVVSITPPTRVAAIGNLVATAVLAPGTVPAAAPVATVAPTVAYAFSPLDNLASTLESQARTLHEAGKNYEANGNDVNLAHLERSFVAFQTALQQFNEAIKSNKDNYFPRCHLTHHLLIMLSKETEEILNNIGDNKVKVAHGAPSFIQNIIGDFRKMSSFRNAGCTKIMEVRPTASETYPKTSPSTFIVAYLTDLLSSIPGALQKLKEANTTFSTTVANGNFSVIRTDRHRFRTHSDCFYLIMKIYKVICDFKEECFPNSSATTAHQLNELKKLIEEHHAEYRVDTLPTDFYEASAKRIEVMINIFTSLCCSRDADDAHLSFADGMHRGAPPAPVTRPAPPPPFYMPAPAGAIAPASPYIRPPIVTPVAIPAFPTSSKYSFPNPKILIALRDLIWSADKAYKAHKSPENLARLYQVMDSLKTTLTRIKDDFLANQVPYNLNVTGRKSMFDSITSHAGLIEEWYQFRETDLDALITKMVSASTYIFEYLQGYFPDYESHSRAAFVPEPRMHIPSPRVLPPEWTALPPQAPLARRTKFIDPAGPAILLSTKLLPELRTKAKEGTVAVQNCADEIISVLEAKASYQTFAEADLLYGCLEALQDTDFFLNSGGTIDALAHRLQRIEDGCLLNQSVQILDRRLDYMSEEISLNYILRGTPEARLTLKSPEVIVLQRIPLSLSNGLIGKSLKSNTVVVVTYGLELGCSIAPSIRADVSQKEFKGTPADGVRDRYRERMAPTPIGRGRHLLAREGDQSSFPKLKHVVLYATKLNDARSTSKFSKRAPGCEFPVVPAGQGRGPRLF